MLWHVTVSQVRYLLAQTELTATVPQIYIGQHFVCSKTMQNSDNYLKDGHLMLPERPRIDGHAVQYTVHTQNTLQQEHHFRVTVTTVTSDTAQVV